MPDELWWIYGVTAAPGPVELDVERIEQDGLVALARPVPAAEFSGAALERRLNDLETLAAMARAHEAVLDGALVAGDVIPLRMCTLYETREAVGRMLHAERERLLNALKHIQGAFELGVKVFAPPSRRDEQARPASGTEYLTARLTQRDEAALSEAAVLRTAAELHARLTEHADDAVLLRPQDRRLNRRESEMVLNGAYLVRRDAAPEFQRLVSSQAGGGELEIELTGPWPPYHFAEVRA
jgi:hypothetical protein